MYQCDTAEVLLRYPKKPDVPNSVIEQCMVSHLLLIGKKLNIDTRQQGQVVACRRKHAKLFHLLNLKLWLDNKLLANMQYNTVYDIHAGEYTASVIMPSKILAYEISD